MHAPHNISLQNSKAMMGCSPVLVYLPMFFSSFFPTRLQLAVLQRGNSFMFSESWSSSVCATCILSGQPLLPVQADLIAGPWCGMTEHSH